MPWVKQTTLSQRSEFVALAGRDGRVIADLCRRFGISRRTASKWLARSPSASTITAILRRHGRLDAAAARKHRPVQRFEHPTPNAPWQLDFKGEIPLPTPAGAIP